MPASTAECGRAGQGAAPRCFQRHPDHAIRSDSRWGCCRRYRHGVLEWSRQDSAVRWPDSATAEKTYLRKITVCHLAEWYPPTHWYSMTKLFMTFRATSPTLPIAKTRTVSLVCDPHLVVAISACFVKRELQNWTPLSECLMFIYCKAAIIGPPYLK